MSSKNSKEFCFHKSVGAWEYFDPSRAIGSVCPVHVKALYSRNQDGIGGSTKGLHIHLGYFEAFSGLMFEV
jgi:hypothetical protein